VAKRVHIVEDDVSFRTALERRLRRAGYDVAVYPSAKGLLDNLPDDGELGCVLLDVQMPGMTGPELQDRLQLLGSILPIVFMTGNPDVRTAVRTIKGGAQDFLTKPLSSEDLLPAIERAVTGHEAALVSKNALSAVRFRIARLTPREREVFDLVTRGQTNKQAARTLGCTERTVKAHRQRVMEKVEVQSLAELVSFAERVGAIDAMYGK
jgi:FixJ family two-component response regulator